MMSTKMTASSLKENLSEFLKQDHEKQRALLGELLFPLVGKYAEEKEQAPKITGMLIDFEVFEVSEILEFLENEELLKERIKEAEDLIESTANN
jgi:polyadenylate-binding protein